jgi:RNA polymerase sigma-70 factor (family 1)
MNNYKTISDEELVSLLRDSDHAAYTEIYNRYFYLMYTHAYKKLRDEEQAKDVIQDLFTNLWHKRESELKMSSLAAYLYTSVRNKIFDLFAHEQVKEKYADYMKNVPSVNKSISADYRVREKELKAYIEKEIQKLPPKMKLIFELSRKDQLSHQEIAERLHTTGDNVSTQLTTALRRLKTKLGLIA